LNPAQTHYTTTERELLSIVETLKEFHNILLGHHLIIHTDHKNLTYANLNTERVMCWHLILEEYAPEFVYLQGEHNIIANALSCLELDTSEQTPEVSSMPSVQESFLHHLYYMADHFALKYNDLPKNAFPLQYKYIAMHQRKDKQLLLKLRARMPIMSNPFVEAVRNEI
jgi:RNase H-like domain found in reverse transcriptase